ncbi:hypothetical protein EDB92DRAFT_1817051 [Lactarius akahatsu]|uniref:Uncharacterized protein n=1 Tax=Lactarius akahatsu TaxID=416441 RepID=A0AAD4QCR5_9AGAM|nr:hypothetical protein EDB92DRAFT_1817051 [Lactarius akahatsu]
MEHRSGIPTQPRAGLLAACSPPSATFSNDTLNDLLRLIGSQKLSGFSEVNTLGLGGMGSPDSMPLDSVGLHLLGRNPQIQANSSSSPPATPQSSLLGPPLDVNTPHVAYSSEALGSAGQSDALAQGKYHIIRNATHEDLLFAQNPTYMRIYSEYTKVSASLTTLEYRISFPSLQVFWLISHRKAYENLVTNLKNEPITQATMTSAYSTGPPALDPALHPLVTLWTWRAFSKEAKARDEFQPTVNAEGEPESKGFWFLQQTDGSMVDIATVTRMRSASKKSWATMKNKYKTLPPTWMNFTPAMQMEFYLDIESQFPFLRLCEDHYKAQKIGTTDYSHWYKRIMKIGKKRGLPKDEPKDEPDLEDALQDTPNTPKRTRLTPSVALSQQASHGIRRSESHVQFPGNLEFDDHPSPHLSTLSPLPPAPESSPMAPTLTLAQTPSSTTPNTPATSLIPDTQPGSATAPATSKSGESPGQSVDGSVAHSTNSSGLGCPPNSVTVPVSFHASYLLSTLSPRTKAIPNPLISSDVVTRNASTPSPLQLNGIRDHSVTALVEDSQHTPISHTNDKTTTPPTDPGPGPILSGPECPAPKTVPAVGVTKTKNKKASAMRPGTSSTARNLFAIDYLKENTATCEEFAKAWKELDDTTRKASWFSLDL